MPASHRDQELIQKYFDARASDAEMVELEKRLAADPEFAAMFADAARLNAGLEQHFRKQYKIAEVATLLESPEQSPANATSASRSRAASAFVPAPAKLIAERLARSASARQFARPRGNPWWRRITAAALLLLAIGGVYWLLQRPGSNEFRLLSGHVAMSGQEVATVSENALFAVAEFGPATFRLPGGGQLKLAAGSAAHFRRHSDRIIVQVVSGGGEFDLSQSRATVHVETVLGTISGAGSRFSVDVASASPREFSSTAVVSVPNRALPNLTVSVVEGSVTVESHGVVTIVRAGETRMFPNPA
jgi:hypothetical protein